MHGLHVIGRILFFVMTAVMLGLPLSGGAFEVTEKNDDYFVLKAGRYYPGARFEVNDFTSAATRSRLEAANGFNGAIAIGHYINKISGIEFGAGYFESKGSPALEPGRTRLKVVPVQLSGKLLLPLGRVEPYGELGVGAYVTKLEVSGNRGSFSGSTKITYGVHGGVGVNVYFTESVFVGIEGRYIQAKPEYGGQPIRLNGYTATVDLGFRY
jgi:opacity protein-like surface antigen